jgi:hypothetical protein
VNQPIREEFAMNKERVGGVRQIASRMDGSKSRRMIACALGALFLSALAESPSAQPRISFPDTSLERRVSIGEILLETVRIEGAMQAWTLRKICLDGQAYWIGFSETNPTGISPAYKDGKPEACRMQSR